MSKTGNCPAAVVADAAHRGEQRGRILQRLAHLARQHLGHQPGGLAFHDGEAGGGAVVALAPLLDEAAEVVVLVGDGVGDFVGQHGLLRFGGGGIGDEELLLVVVVEGGGLFGEQVDGALGEVEIRRDEAEFLEREFFGAHFLGLGDFLDALIEELVDLVLADEIAGHGMVQGHAGDPGELLGQGLDLGAEFAGPIVWLPAG